LAVAAVESPVSDSHILQANVADLTVTPQEQTPTPAVPASHSEDAATSVGQAQRPNPQRAVSRAAEIQPPTSTRIPSVAEAEFDRARELFDRKEYAAAADGFQRVIAILSAGSPSPSSSALRSTANEMAAASHAALAAASQSALAAASQPVAVVRNERVIEQEPVKPPLSRQATPDVTPDSHVYKAGDDGVIGPSPLKQYIPPQPAAGVRPSDLSVLELLIDSRGAVESVHLQNPKNRFRDEWWLAAAKAWQFRPASKDGQPVKFLERVLITTFTPTDPQ
jgi:hypothetical protein